MHHRSNLNWNRCMSSKGTIQEQVVHTLWTLCCNGLLRGFSELNPTSHWTLVLAPTYFFPPWSYYLLTLHQSLEQNLSNTWCSTFEISVVQLWATTEIMLIKSLFKCVNRSRIQYSFRAVARCYPQSWTKVLGHFWVSGAFSDSHRSNPSPHPTYNVGRVYPEFFPSFNFV